jgi:hypothetical protein
MNRSLRRMETLVPYRRIIVVDAFVVCFSIVIYIVHCA